jgi:hypothetical protein
LLDGAHGHQLVEIEPPNWLPIGWPAGVSSVTPVDHSRWSQV